MKDKLYTIVFMIVVTALATAAMTGTKLLLTERIENNEALADNRARLMAFGLMPADAVPANINAVHGGRIKESEKKTRDQKRIWIAYKDDAKTEVLAVGFEFVGKGLWGPFEGVLALDPELKSIVGFVITKHQETPGLGARMADDDFREKIVGLSARRRVKGVPYVIFVAPTAKAQKEEGEVNAISGATNTTAGLDEMLNRVLNEIQGDFGANPDVIW
jgi:Na+-transporting NADH:ubiquinone oxidoreductase subunit C